MGGTGKTNTQGGWRVLCCAGKTKASPNPERKVIRGRLGLRVGKQFWGKGGHYGSLNVSSGQRRVGRILWSKAHREKAVRQDVGHSQRAQQYPAWRERA